MQKTCGCRKNTLPLHSQSGIESIDDSVAQQVEHNTFNVGVLGSSPSWITEEKRQKATIKRQVLQNQYFVGLFCCHLATLTAKKITLTDKN